MSYVQISTIAVEDLSRDQVEWIKEADPALFVDVVKGDESKPLKIQPEALTLDNVLDEIVFGQRIVFGEDPEYIPSNFVEVTTSYWLGDWTFEKIDDVF